MAELAERHPRLNILNLDAAAAGIVLGATLLLSVEAARGLLPVVLDAENVRWRAVEVARHGHPAGPATQTAI